MIEQTNLTVALRKNLLAIRSLDEKHHLIKSNGLFLSLIFVIEIYAESS